MKMPSTCDGQVVGVALPERQQDLEAARDERAEDGRLVALPALALMHSATLRVEPDRTYVRLLGPARRAKLPAERP